MRAKIVAVFMALLSVICLSACQKNTAPKIGICWSQDADGLVDCHQQALTQALQNAGFQVTAVHSQNDQAKQFLQLRRFLKSGYDLVVIQPVMASQTDAMAQQLDNAGIPGIVLQTLTTFSRPKSNRSVCYIGSDAYEPGLLLGQALLQTPNQGDLNDDGVISYVFIGGPEDHIDGQFRMQGCSQALEHLRTKMLYYCHGDWTEDSGRTLARQMLSVYGEGIDVLFCGNDAMTLGAMDAIADAGRTVGQDIYLMGIGNDPQVLTRIKNGQISATVAIDRQAWLDTVLGAIHGYLNGERVASQHCIDYTIVTQ